MAIRLPSFSGVTLRAGPIICQWGITLPWIMGATARRKWIQRKMCFIASPEFISSGRGESKHAAHRARDHQFFIRANDAHGDATGLRGNHRRILRVARLVQFDAEEAKSFTNACANG